MGVLFKTLFTLMSWPDISHLNFCVQILRTQLHSDCHLVTHTSYSVLFGLLFEYIFKILSLSKSPPFFFHFNNSYLTKLHRLLPLKCLYNISYLLLDLFHSQNYSAYALTALPHLSPPTSFIHSGAGLYSYTQL